ncbi:MAG: glycosyltransferase [Bacteroidetes bacterium]|nr:glycosyltransferase [Bacteroidota bacterium]
MVGAIIIGLYGLSLLVIFFYAVIQFSLAVSYLWFRKKKATLPPQISGEFPFVTIQLPIYNEKYVVERLLQCTVQMDWPAEKLEIQVLDDSTDETSALVDKTVTDLQSAGVMVNIVRRPAREGYKAGALKHGLALCRGEFIVIFDADFVPDPQFLKKTIPFFADEKVGVVQTHWEHLNRNFSVLTKLQAFALDAHFSVEQVGRNVNGFFINFNGTAGVWRRKTIENAGGWEADTLTEDLDLSYRAQMKGWKFIYREDVGSPAELPVAMSALKSQQFRWTKGGAETFKKMSGRLIQTPGLRFSERINGLAHLFNSSVFVFVLLLSLSSVVLVYLVTVNSMVSAWLNYASVFFISTLFLMFYYAVSFREKTTYPILRGPLFVFRFFQFLVVSMGLSYHNTVAVLQGYFGKKTAFVRTPKFNTGNGAKSRWKTNAYLSSGIKLSTWIEFVLFLFFCSGIVIGIQSEVYGMIPFHSMAALGFLSVFLYSITESTRG